MLIWTSTLSGPIPGEHLEGQTGALESLPVEMLARGLSACDIEDAFRDESGRLLLSKAAVAEIGEQLWEDCQAFKSRDLNEYEIAYLLILRFCL